MSFHSQLIERSKWETYIQQMLGYYIKGDGEELFRLACEHDLEGIVAKRKGDPYLPEHATWFKIRNTNYTQWVGREELFERERKGEPGIPVWSDCVQACEPLAKVDHHAYG